MEIISEGMPDHAALPRRADGLIDVQGLLRLLAEQTINAVMDEQAEMFCAEAGVARNGYRDRTLKTCVGDLAPRVPKVRLGSFFPQGVIERYKRVDRALAAAVAEMCAGGTSTRKVQRVAERMGVSSLSKDKVTAICACLDADVDELVGRPLSGAAVPYLWLDATYVKCRREGRVASTAVVTAIGCDGDGWRRVLGITVVDTESYDSWLGFLRALRDRGVAGVRLVVSDAHKGLTRAISEVFQGAAWQRCVVHLVRDCVREAGSRQPRKRVARVVAPVFRAKGAAATVAMYHVACDMLRDVCPKAADILEEAEPDALAYLDLPASHWKRLHTNNVQERANREIKRRSRVVQVFPSEGSPMRLAGAVMCDMDEAWSSSMYFSEARMRELPPEGEAAPPRPAPTEADMEAARRVLESADEGFADRGEGN